MRRREPVVADALGALAPLTLVPAFPTVSRSARRRRPRAWPAAQAVLVLAVNHLLLTVW